MRSSIKKIIKLALPQAIWGPLQAIRNKYFPRFFSPYYKNLYQELDSWVEQV